MIKIEINKQTYFINDEKAAVVLSQFHKIIDFNTSGYTKESKMIDLKLLKEYLEDNSVKVE